MFQGLTRASMTSDTPRTLYDNLWDSHLVRQEQDGTGLLYIDRHLVHEVTSPQAYEGLTLAGRKQWRVESVVATADHNTPTKTGTKASPIPSPGCRSKRSTTSSGNSARKSITNSSPSCRASCP